jgi:hypothetical protein
VKRNPHKRRCQGVRKDGSPCRKWAVPTSEEPLCAQHLMGEEEWLEQARRGGRGRAAQRREEAGIRPSVGLAPSVTLADVLRVCVPALEATFEHDGSPDWGARLAAAGTILAAFPKYLRSTPAEVRTLLAEVLPDEVYSHPEARHRLNGHSVYSAMRREWDRLPSWSPVRGLCVKPYPSHMIAPWEDPAEVQKERPADVPPEEAPVMHLPDGGIALERDGELPVLLRDGGLIKAPNVLK